MDESVRMVCPECRQVYRLKRPVPGKVYTCKKCGASGLEIMPPESVETAEPPASLGAGSRIASLYANDAPPLPDSGLSELRGEIERQVSLLSDAGRQVRESADRMESELSRLDESVTERFHDLGNRMEDGVAGRLREIGDKVAELTGRLDFGKVDALSEQLRETGGGILSRLDEHSQIQKEHLAQILRESGVGGAEGGGTAASTLDADALAEKILAGIAQAMPDKLASLDGDSGSVIDALARVADGLVKEQNANTERLDHLSKEIRTAVSSISNLDEWRGTLPAKVADEIGRTVEDRVVGPVSGALARQAPAILSELQDNKLVDIVSRSVREAQRPLLREILANGRNGVPIWLFAAVLLPLLMVLGYLFLPGELIGASNAQANAAAEAEYRARMEAELAAVAEGLKRVESGGLPLPADADGRLKNVEDVVLDLHGEALAHAKNAAALEEEAKGLRETIAERDRLIKEYSEMLQRQVKRIRAYEARLTRLGVSPDSVEE